MVWPEVHSAHPFGSVVCRWHEWYPAFASDILLLLLAFQKWQLGFRWDFFVFGFFFFFCIFLPIICPNTVIFSPFSFLCILLLEEMFVQVQALQPLPQRVPSTRSQPVSDVSDGVQSWKYMGIERS